MIYDLKSVIPSSECGTYLAGSNRYVRAMHLPFYPGLKERFRDAWAVFSRPGKVVCLSWPKDGEFELALMEKSKPTGQYYGGR
jgi:hypothetical protein